MLVKDSVASPRAQDTLTALGCGRAAAQPSHNEGLGTAHTLVGPSGRPNSRPPAANVLSVLHTRCNRACRSARSAESYVMIGDVDEFNVQCPYCGEDVEIYVEPDVRGTFVQDCEVCCNPWRVRVRGVDDERVVEVARADGSE